MKKVVLFLIELYRRAISPYRFPSCRFVPSCSAYAQEAVNRHGLGTGGRLTFLRLLRCQPWHRGGADPVPGFSGMESSS